MLSLRPLDPVVPIVKQLQCTATPVVLVNLFAVADADIPALMAAWEKDANWMKRQPGFISTQLHRAIGASCMLMNYAVWESVECFRAAFTHPEFASALGAYPSSAVAQPHLFTKVAVPNLCAA
ncbi:MAG TPA: antibiotic biosynthesis monooxygenase family protein [Burkholderiaceae bacterium]|nr:antibiotic biosynthesis monooxygenase family protein [Burkholderiaceae bacterium]